jgi:hypothetical protein
MIDQTQLLRLLGVPQIAIDRVEITDADALEIHVHSIEGLDHRSGQRCSFGVQGFSLGLPIQG